MFKGSCVAIVTPFKNGKIDRDALVRLVEFHAKNGTAAVVPCGTTGESATLSHKEHEEVVSITIEAAAKKVPVMAGAGSNSTAETIRMSKFAQDAGADAVLLITPYYNKPTQAGLIAHFEAVANSIRIPVILYNIPGRTAVDMLPETVAELAKRCKNIVGIKEATGSIDRVSQAVAGMPGFTVLSGDDSLTLPMMSVGAQGVISVIANIIPGDVARMCKLALEGKFTEARGMHLKMFPLIKALFLETNPIPVKTAMEMMGLCGGELRLPMVPMSPANREKLAAALKNYGIKNLKK